MTTFLLMAFLIIINYLTVKKLIIKNAGNANFYFKSLPYHYALSSCLWSLIAFIALILIFKNNNSTHYLKILISLTLVVYLSTIIIKKSFLLNFNAKAHLEKFIKIILILCAIAAALTTIIIVLAIFFESLKFFKMINIFDFLFGLKWNPQSAIREGQSISHAQFGAIPVFTGTFLITFIAIFIAAPLGLFSAIYLSEYSSLKVKKILKPALEILSGIPTVVYGYFAAIIIAPKIKIFGEFLGLQTSSESALAAGLIMGIMIIPFISSLSEDVISSVPTNLKEGSLALGSTKSEMIVKVIIPTALPGIISSLLLAISRAIGETMIVVMAAGLIAKLTINPLDSVTTATAQIVNILAGDQEFDSAKTLSAFALAITLFTITLLLNLLSLAIIKKYRKKY